VCPFVGGLLGNHPLQSLDSRPRLLVQPGHLEEQRGVPLPQSFPPLLRPRLVAVLRQQLPRVQVHRSPVGRRVAETPRLGGGLLETPHVHPERSSGEQLELLPPEAQVPGLGCRQVVRLEDPAGRVERAVQVVGGGPGAEARPEQVHRLLLVQPVGRLQGEQLDQGRRLA
jgi:hypothetical protein